MRLFKYLLFTFGLPGEIIGGCRFFLKIGLDFVKNEERKEDQ